MYTDHYTSASERASVVSVLYWSALWHVSANYYYYY